jgi:hypothetical protein
METQPHVNPFEFHRPLRCGPTSSHGRRCLQQWRGRLVRRGPRFARRARRRRDGSGAGAGWRRGFGVNGHVEVPGFGHEKSPPGMAV